jgi:hypothetical protein
VGHSGPPGGEDVEEGPHYSTENFLNLNQSIRDKGNVARKRNLLCRKSEEISIFPD